MAAALLTAIFASITGIAASIYLGYQSASTAALAQHISIGIFSAMITLLAHSMMMFYFLGKARAVREAAAEGGLSKDFERRIAVVRAPVFSIATVAMLLTMVTALLGASVDTGVVSPWIHSTVAIACLLANLRAIQLEIRALTESARVVAEVNRLLADGV
jgi:hypothetical protein